jgi:type IV secretion system protein TrbL
MRVRHLLAVALAVLVAMSVCVGTAGAQTGGTDPGASPEQSDNQKQDDDFGDKCRPGIPGIDEIAEGACDVGKGAADAVTGAPGAIATSVAGSALDQATKWMTDAATWTTKQIATGIQKTSTPELKAGWYEERFASMIALGLGLAALVTMMALASAAIRRDPEALGATVYGMLRAGLGTGLVLVLTVLALGVADEIANTMAGETMGRDAGQFWNEVGDAWGNDNFAGFGSSAIAFFFAFVQVIAGLLVWIEMLLRSAAIYIAVLFLPAALAASIWPPLREWEARLVKVLFVLIAMKPVIITVLSLAGHAAAAAITGEARGDIGVMLAAIVIFALAACVPWALMTMVSMSGDGAWSAHAAHHGARQGMSASASKVGGTLGNARSATSRMHGARGGGPDGSSGAGGGGKGGPGSGGPGKTGGPGSAGGGGGAAASAGAAGGRAAAGAGGAAAKAAGPVGTVAAAAGMTYAAGKATGQRAGQTAEEVGGGGSTPPSSRDARRGSAGGENSSSGGPRRAPGGRTGSAPPSGGGGSRPPAPRTGQRPGGGRPPTPPAGGSGA